jgi:alkylation response protein AidB-like acyl-CoA dehydrogenase
MFLQEERTLLNTIVPGLDALLQREGVLQMESKTPEQLKKIMQDFQLLSLWIPAEYGGKAIPPRKAIRLQTAIASRAPSMALMLTMHNFTVSFNTSLAKTFSCSAELLRKAAHTEMLIGSAFAEGRYGAGILDSTVFVEETGGGYLINGVKKPCTMASVMDIITVGVAKKINDEEKLTGMAILDRASAGVSSKPFWKIPLLEAADNNELCFDNAFVAKDQVIFPDPDDLELSQLVGMGEVSGLCWFEIVACASYLGAVSSLAERVLSNSRIDSSERTALGAELMLAQAALDGAINLMENDCCDRPLLNKVLLIRFAIQKIIERCAMHAAELVGCLSFIKDTEIMSLLAACRCLAFHPISRKAAEPFLAQWLGGEA